MAENITIINSEDILELFGLKSNIYNESTIFLNNQMGIEKSFEKNYKHWREIFDKIYGRSISSELFIKHSYFTHILKILLISKIKGFRNLNYTEIYQEYIKSNLIDLRLSLIHI